MAKKRKSKHEKKDRDRQDDLTEVEVPDPPRQPLPVTIVPGMRVVDMTTETAGTIVGITEAYCIYRFAESDALGVANWRDTALANVCPAEPLLPADVSENDQRNGRATVLRGLLAIRPAEMTRAEAALRDELLRYLCGDDGQPSAR